MSRQFLSSVIIITASLIILSCQEKGVKSNSENLENNESSTSITLEDNHELNSDWKLVWSDEFKTGSIDKSSWNLQLVEAGRFNDEWQRYTDSPENAYIENDCLIIKAIHESDSHGINQYTSARLNTANKRTWKYGKIAARIKLPEGNGIWPAFWMLGANIDENGGDTPWPQSGEIDILELYGSKDNGAIEANMHYADASDSHAMMGAVTFRLEQGIFADDFHIFELAWDQDSITWFVDGQRFAWTSITAEDRSEFHEPFFILLNIAVGGAHAGRPDSNTSFPQHMYVDWIRVYEKI
ncbi:MAG: glycoside hydrolase family 16 protein [Flavobacteriaceae bacterium]|nr:glycoside hydrolase family 16 protein [Bacteroidia bacterium]NNK87855.1 glycoside hydrolase family 16 protein [Flavobacteriaceae bacterium]